MAKNDLSPLVMMADARISKLEKALDKAARKVDKSTNKMTKSWKGHMRTVEKRHAKFGKALGRNIGLGLAAGTIAFVAFTKMALQSADDLQHFSDQVGISTTKLQEYKFVASRLGISQEQMNKAFKTGTANIGEFATSGMGEAKDALEKLGLAEDILTHKITDTGEILDILIGKLGEEKNALVRAGWAAEIFGKKSGVVLSEMLGLGTDAINEMKKEAHDLGIIMDASAVQKASDANDMLGKLADTIKGNLTKAVVELAPEIEQLAKSVIRQMPELVAWFTTAIGKVNDFADGIDRLKGNQPKVRTSQGAQKSIRELNSLYRQQRAYQKLLEENTKGRAELKRKFGADDEGRNALIKSTSQKTFDDLGRELKVAEKALRKSVENAFGSKVITDIERSGGGFLDIKGLIATRRRELENLKVELLREDSTVPSVGGFGGGDGGGGTSGGLSKDDKARAKAWQTAMAAQQKIMADQLRDAAEMWRDAQTPLEQYQARLVELAAKESNVLYAMAVEGGAFTKARVDALVELADATVDLENDTSSLNPILAELNRLTKEGGVNAKAAKELYEKLTKETRELNSETENYLDQRRIEHAINIAGLSGDKKRLQQLSREAEILRRITDLQQFGGVKDADQARGIATREIDEETIAAARGQFRQVFSDALYQAVIEGDWRGAASGIFETLGNRMFDNISNSLADAVFDQLAAIAPDLLGNLVGDTTLAVAIQGAHTAGGATVATGIVAASTTSAGLMATGITTSGATAALAMGGAITTAGTAAAALMATAIASAGIGGKSGGGSDGLIASGIGAIFGGGKSFDGGGYTGSGSRSGGIDGKGGFPAILHPREQVIDFTKGRGVVTAKANAGQTVINQITYAPITNLYGHTEADLERNLNIRDEAVRKEIPGLINQHSFDRARGAA